MEQFSTMFLEFIASWGYFAIAILMAAENACIPIPSELILGFAGYLIFSGQLTFAGALTAGMVGGMVGSIFAYLVGHYGGRSFVDRYGHYFFIKKSHVDVAQNWFDMPFLSPRKLLPAVLLPDSSIGSSSYPHPTYFSPVYLHSFPVIQGKP